MWHLNGTEGLLAGEGGASAEVTWRWPEGTGWEGGASRGGSPELQPGPGRERRQGRGAGRVVLQRMSGRGAGAAAWGALQGRLVGAGEQGSRSQFSASARGVAGAAGCPWREFKVRRRSLARLAVDPGLSMTQRGGGAGRGRAPGRSGGGCHLGRWPDETPMSRVTPPEWAGRRRGRGRGRAARGPAVSLRCCRAGGGVRCPPPPKVPKGESRPGTPRHGRPCPSRSRSHKGYSFSGLSRHQA